MTRKYTPILFAVVCSLLGWSAARPARAGFGVFVSGPQFAFSLSGGTNVFWLPAFSSFAYYSNGYYFRWINGGWLYAPVYAGPWAPVAPWFALPPVLVYGPPPPVVVYRPYFVWWRERVGPWYQRYHPHWWQAYHPYLRHYAVWRRRAVPYFRAHPMAWQHPRMHPYFRPTHPNYRRSFLAAHPHMQRRYSQYRAAYPHAPGHPGFRGGPGARGMPPGRPPFRRPFKGHGGHGHGHGGWSPH